MQSLRLTRCGTALIRAQAMAIWVMQHEKEGEGVRG
jgi:hypothetical protein